MASRLSEADMLRLVEIYREYECLWNVRSELYKNRDARDSTYKEIRERLNISGLLVKHIPQKIKNLRTSYYQELRKIENSIRSGASADCVYKPKVSWFMTADGFLKSFRNNENTFCNVDENSSASISTQSTGYTNNSTEDVSNSTQSPEALENSSLHKSTEIQSDRNETPKSSFIAPASRRPFKKVKNDDIIIYEAIDKLDNIAKRITRNIETVPKNTDDEFDGFGKYLAAILRSLPTEMSIIAKTEIQKTVSDIQIRTLRQSQTTMVSDASTSNSYDDSCLSFDEELDTYTNL